MNPYLDFLIKAQEINMTVKFLLITFKQHMITHDCLNIINKNFTVILISLLYLAKFFSNKTANNTVLSLICMKNELL